MKPRPTTLLLLLLTATLVACGSADDDRAGNDSPVDGGVGTPDDDADGSGGGEDDGADSGSSQALLGDEVMTAIDALIEELGIERDTIEVRVTELVTWPDASIGCPQPDEVYTQALVEGYRIVLSADGQQFTFHGERDGPPLRCEDPDEPAAITR